MEVDEEYRQQHAPQHYREESRKHVSRYRAIRRYTVIVLALLAILLSIALTASAVYVWYTVPQTPSVAVLLKARDAQPSILLSAQERPIATYSRGLQERVRLDQISPHAINALIATEDHRFYGHRGVDVGRTLAAVLHTARGDAQGGSTITQQLVRNLFPQAIGRARTINRKLREIITALKIEDAYTKDQILETYLNNVPFLYNVVGIEMAARTYYDKRASELDVLESATLIGMLKGTSYYNPVINPERAQRRRNVVLSQMRKHGMLSTAEYDALRVQPLQVTFTRQPDPLGEAPHFAAHVRRQLLAWAQQNDYNIHTDGLVVHSTLDDALQATAAEAVARQAQVLQDIADVEWGRSSERVASETPSAYAALRKNVEPFRHFWQERPDLLDAFIRESPEYRKATAAGADKQATLAKLKADSRFLRRLRTYKTRLEAGFLAMDPRTGNIKAWVGSRDFQRDQFDHVAQAMRQPGSTFKPIVYGAALEQGLRPDSIYPDGQVEIRSVDGSIWRPTDMSGYSGRMMSMREGLIFSKNTITAQVMQDAGLPQVINLAQALGIKRSRLNPVPSLSLGTSPVTLLEMVSAYATIARIGEYREPLCITKITDREGNVLAEFDTEAQRAMSQETAIELIDMMRGVVRYGTGTEVRNRFHLVADIAGKTGTTQNNTDGWFILMHPDLVAGAWVGFNDSRVTMRSDHWGQGGHNALLLVGDFFRDTLKTRRIDTKARFPQPERPPPLMVTAPLEEWIEQAQETMGALPPGHGVVTRHASGTTVVVGPDGVQTAERNRDTVGDDALGRFLNGIERGISSSGSNGRAGRSDSSDSFLESANDRLFPEVGN